MFHTLSCLPILGEQLSLQIETSSPSLMRIDTPLVGLSYHKICKK
jgi:hypothetical protein